MKKLAVLFVAMILFVALLNAQGNKIISHELDNFTEEWQGNATLQLENEDVNFRAYIASRPQYVLEGPNEDMGLRANYVEELDQFLVTFNVHTFNTSLGAQDWSPGEMIRIEVTQPGTEGVLYTEFPIEKGSSPQIMVVTVEDVQLPIFTTELRSNYPNPFNPNTTINFSIANEERVTIEVFNSKGQKVLTLVDDQLEAGHHSVVWNGRNAQGREVGSGIYFYRMKTEEWSETEKMLLVK